MAGQKQNIDRFREQALGLVSTQSFPAIVGTADSMVKAASVTLVGYEMIGAGQCTAIVRGSRVRGQIGGGDGGGNGAKVRSCDL